MLEQRLITSLAGTQQWENETLLGPNRKSYAAGMQVPLHPGIALPSGSVHAGDRSEESR